MISLRIREQIIKELAQQFGVYDVYWHKDRLYIINSYDIPYVEDYIETSDLGQYITYQYVEEDEPCYA